MLKPTPALSPELPNPVLARELHTNHKAEDRTQPPFHLFPDPDIGSTNASGVQKQEAVYPMEG